jgi:DNA-directed RNA polymerase subunit omega
MGDGAGRFSAARSKCSGADSPHLGALPESKTKLSMNAELLKAASQVIPDNGILVNLMSRRVRQLSLGHRPLVEHAPGLGLADIALTEIAQKKLTFESTFGKNAAAESTQVVEFPKVSAAVSAKKKAA